MGKIICMEETKCSLKVFNNQDVCVLGIDAEVVEVDGYGKQVKITTDRPVNGKTEFYKDFDGAPLPRSIVKEWLYEETGIYCPILECSDLKEFEIEVSDEDIITFFPD